jgi:hypothetical protein
MLGQPKREKSVLMRVDPETKKIRCRPSAAQLASGVPHFPQPAGDDVVRSAHELLCLLVVLDDEDDRRLPDRLVPRLKIVVSPVRFRPSPLFLPANRRFPRAGGAGPCLGVNGLRESVARVSISGG